MSQSKPPTSNDILPETLVWLPSNRGGSRTLHTDPDCRYLKQCENRIGPKRRAEFPQYDVCQYCLGHVSEATADSSYFESLVAAAADGGAP